MRILITGTTGYIGKRLIPLLLNENHEIICVVRDKLRIESSYLNEDNIEVIEADFLDLNSLKNIPKDIDFAYYLIHSMSNSSKDFEEMEERCAKNFKTYFETTHVQQVIYLGGIANEEVLSKHLQSRKNVEKELKSESYALTVFRAGIIQCSGRHD